MYTFKFKKRSDWFWRKRKASGHRAHNEADRMDIFLENGGIYSIGEWSKYDLYLGLDWIAATKAKMEEESGQDIKLKSNIGA